MTKILSLLIPCLLIASTSWSYPAPVDGATIGKLFETGDFAALEAMAEQARTSKESNSEGDWQLSWFYHCLYPYAEKMAANSESSFRKHMGAWAEQFPKSITWRLVMAAGIEQLGWSARGSGWAKDVSEHGWSELEKRLTEAWKILQDARKISTADPALYVSLTSVALGLRDDPTSTTALRFSSLVKQMIRDAFGLPPTGEELSPLEDQIFEEAIARETMYTPLYYAQVNHLLPRWGGAPMDLEHFAERAAALTASQSGDAMYARVAWGALALLAEEQYVGETTFEWPRIKAGYERLLEEFPDSNLIKNQFCRMACVYKDRETGAAMLKAMDHPLPVKVWRNQGFFNYWSDWINEKAEYPSMSPMVLAAAANDLRLIEELARKGESVNVTMLGGRTPLMLAVGKHDLAMTKLLLQLDADIEVTSLKGNTPLTEAARLDDTAILEALLEKGANPDRPNPEGWRAIHQTCKDGNIAAARLLLAAKADVNGRGAEEWTPLHVAVETNHADMVRFLLQNGADKTLKLSDGRTALDIATKQGFSDIAKLLQ